jgi:hypothetical protein
MIGARAGWLSLNKISQSFLAKGVTILSLTAFALANFPRVEALLGSSGWRIKALFIGSLLFVIGHSLAALRAPPEFGGRSEATHVVAEMLVLDTRMFFDGRLQMLRELTAAFGSHPPFDLPQGYLQLAQSAITEASGVPPTGDDFKNYSRNVYHADIQLRQFDGPIARYSALLLLGLGVGLMLVPTLLNVGATVWSFL